MSYKKNKILISGATGMLGKALLSELLQNKEYELFYISHTNSNSIDYAKLIQRNELVNIDFYAFFHCAAEVNVNLCQRDLDHAMKSNCIYVQNLFNEVKAKNYFLISTDSVYSGFSGNHKETDEVRPLNNYALSKLRGEEVARDLKENLYIIRTNIIGNDSKGKSSLFEWSCRELLKGNTISGFKNVFFNPLSVQHLSKILLQILKKNLDYGTYNIGSDTTISKYEFLINVARLIKANPNLVVPTDFVANADIALRPMNSSLNCNKLKNQIENIDLSLNTSLNLLIISNYEKN